MCLLLIWAVSRIQFFEAVRPTSSFLKTERSSLLLEDVTFVGSWPSSRSSKPAMRGSRPHVFLTLPTTASASDQRKALSLLLRSHVIRLCLPG